MWRVDNCFIMVVSFVVGCAHRMCQIFLSECVSIIVFDLVIMDF